MGIEINIAEFLVAVRQTGVDYGRVCTLGRQDLLISAERLYKLLSRMGVDASGFDGEFVRGQPRRQYADGIFRLLDASEVVAVDFCDFQGARIVHDLNQPIGPELHEQFDTVFDGGTLEHVFNFPVAIKNVMEMVRVGGRLLIQAPANNFCGHGFYQFSPELFYRVLSAENGYRVSRMVIFEWDAKDWYEVRDPASLKQRVELVNARYTGLLIEAERIARVPIFQSPPLQSDYAEVLWKERDAEQPPVPKSKIKTLVKSMLGPSISPYISRYLCARFLKRIRRQADRRRTLENREFFSPVERRGDIHLIPNPPPSQGVNTAPKT
jgi:SAM-dependent methyltransferase